MDNFLIIATSFPTVVFTTALVVVLGYWLAVIVGGLDMDVLDAGPDAGAADMDGDPGSSVPGVAGLLIRLRLDGVPLTVVLSFIVLVGWLACYFAMRALLPVLPLDIMRWLVGVGVLLAALVVAVALTGQLIRPLRPLFRGLSAHHDTQLLGQVAIVRTSSVSGTFGEAMLNDGGAGLILKIRTDEPNELRRGDRVVLIEQLPTQHAWRVIPEHEFV